MSSNDTNAWTPILESLDKQCDEHKVSDAFRKTLHEDLFDKALIPIVKEAPVSVAVYPPDTDVTAFTVHCGWLVTLTEGVRLTVHRPVSSLRSTSFIVCSFKDKDTLNYNVFDTAKRVAKELKSRIDKLRHPKVED